jgi:hypothetical protein
VLRSECLSKELCAYHKEIDNFRHAGQYKKDKKEGEKCKGRVLLLLALS